MIDIQKRNTKKYIVIFFLILLFSTTFFIMYKYYVEGEKNLPFNITKLVVVSSAKTENIEINENTYEANVIQKNDIYIAIEKNKDYSKEDAIKKITLNNFKVVEQGKKGIVRFYRTPLEGNTFEYIENYEIKDSVEYKGSKETNLNLENMTIANQGGILELSVILNDLGKVTYLENDNVITDGRLLNRLQMTNEDVKVKISFDMTIELSGGNTFKTTIILDLPVGDIATEGVSTCELDLTKLVFKRV